MTEQLKADLIEAIEAATGEKDFTYHFQKGGVYAFFNKEYGFSIKEDNIMTGVFYYDDPVVPMPYHYNNAVYVDSLRAKGY